MVKRSTVVGVIGLGRVGLPLSVLLAKGGYYTIGVDIDKNKVRQLAGSNTDCLEPDLEETLRQSAHNLHFTTRYEELNECEAVFITVGTPLQSDNTGPDYSQMKSALTNLGKNVKAGTTVILKSTVVPGTTENWVAPFLQEVSGLVVGKELYLAFCPERVVGGRVLFEWANLPKVVGGVNAESAARAASYLKALGGKIITVSSPKVAELCKLIDNSYRTMNIAFANEVTQVCEKLGVDAYEVTGAVNDSYSRTHIYGPGLGADGPCLYKDSRMFQLCSNNNCVSSEVMSAAIKQSQFATLRIGVIISEYIKRIEVDPVTVSLLGLAFKGQPETDDIRDSAAIKIRHFLQENSGSRIRFKYYDPHVHDFLGNAVSATAGEALRDANVVVFLTNNPALMGFDVNSILGLAARPLLIIDGWRNVLDLDKADTVKDVTTFRVGRAEAQDKLRVDKKT